MIVGVALTTVTLSVVVTVLKLVESVGVKVTPCGVVPIEGAVLGAVNVKLPATLATPLDSVEKDRVWPKAI